MGTSSSHGGQKDRPPLLPDWALPPPSPPTPPPPREPNDDSADDQDGSEKPAPHPAAPNLNPAKTPVVGPAAGKAYWTRAGNKLGSVASSGGTKGLRAAGRAYVRARGGSGQAASSAVSGRRTTARMAGFLADVGNRGLATALANLGLGSLVGRDLESVIAAVNDAICPAGADRQDAAVREAGTDTLQLLFTEVIEAGGDINQLNSMSPEAVGRAIEAMVASFIYNRWLAELGIKIETKAIAADKAVRTEQRMKAFIQDAVKYDISQKDALKIDWKGSEGQSMIDRIFQDAYAVIGGRP